MYLNNILIKIYRNLRFRLLHMLHFYNFFLKNYILLYIIILILFKYHINLDLNLIYMSKLFNIIINISKS